MINGSFLQHEVFLIADSAIEKERGLLDLTEGELRQRIEKDIQGYQHTLLEIELSEPLACLRALCRLLSINGKADYPNRLQIAAAAALFKGAVIDMANGEGKTLAGALAVALRAKMGMNVHISTFNDYLVRRDATWMWPIYHALGLSAAALEESQYYGLRVTGSNIDDFDAIPVEAAYKMPVLYAEKTRLGHDYLRDNLITALSGRKQGELQFVLIDEVDSTLIDEARTPLTITGEDSYNNETAYSRAWAVCQQMVRSEHYKVDLIGEAIDFTDQGRKLASGLLQADLYRDPDVLWAELLTICLRAREFYHRGRHYQVLNGELGPIDEYTGRYLNGRVYSGGLHQALLLKEGLKFQANNRRIATISIQNFYKQYRVISGMSGSIWPDRKEIEAVYKVPVLKFDTQVEIKRKDAKYVIYNTIEERDNHAVQASLAQIERGRPVLISVEDDITAESIRKKLAAHDITPQILTATENQNEAEKISHAGEPKTVMITTKLAGRGTDIKLSPEAKEVGGLHVIVVGLRDERHEIQLRGRAGRRGKPGSSECFISLFDQNMKSLITSRLTISAIMRRLGMEEGVAIVSPMVDRRIENARAYIKEHRFHDRSNLLIADSILDGYRQYVYSIKRSIVHGMIDLHHLLRTFAENHVARLMDQVLTGLERGKDLDKASMRIVNQLCQTLAGVSTISFPNIGQIKDKHGRTSLIANCLNEVFEARKGSVQQACSPADELNKFEAVTFLFQSIVLNAIDHSWAQFLDDHEIIHIEARVKNIDNAHLNTWLSKRLNACFQTFMANVELGAISQWSSKSRDDETARSELLLALQNSKQWEGCLKLYDKWASIKSDNTPSKLRSGALICEIQIGDLERAIEWYVRAFDASLSNGTRDEQWFIAAEILELAGRCGRLQTFYEFMDRVNQADRDFKSLGDLLLDLALISQESGSHMAQRQEANGSLIDRSVPGITGLPRHNNIIDVVERMFNRALSKFAESNDVKSIASLLDRQRESFKYWHGERNFVYLMDQRLPSWRSREELLSDISEAESETIISNFIRQAISAHDVK
jgi:preprotein translocase subunit SecA